MKRKIARRGEPRRWLDNHLANPPQTDNCIDWPYGTTGQSYGQIRLADKMCLVTHVVLEHSGYPRPSAPVNNACHTCDRPKCCNVRHLYWGSHDDNAADKVRRGRHRNGDQRGLKNPRAVLNEDDVRNIRKRHADGETQTSIAISLGISITTTHNVVKHKSWQHVK